MSKKPGSLVSTVLASVLEKGVFRLFSKARRNLARALEAAPEGAARLTAAHVALIVVATATAGGLLLLPVGLVLTATALAADSVNKPLLAGVLLSILGATYLIGGLVILRFVISTVRSSIAKATREAVRKLDR